MIKPVVEALNSSTERLYNVPDVPRLVKFQLEFVNGSVDLVKAGNFGIRVGDYIARAVIGVLNGEFGLFVELQMVSFLITSAGWPHGSIGSGKLSVNRACAAGDKWRVSPTRVAANWQRNCTMRIVGEEAVLGNIHDLALHQSASSYDRAANLAPASWPDPAVACPDCWPHWPHSLRANSSCCSSPSLCPWTRCCRHDLLGELSAGDGEESGPLRRSGQAGCLESKLTRTFGPGRDARDILLQR